MDSLFFDIFTDVFFSLRHYQRGQIVLCLVILCIIVKCSELEIYQLSGMIAKFTGQLGHGKIALWQQIYSVAHHKYRLFNLLSLKRLINQRTFSFLFFFFFFFIKWTLTICMKCQCLFTGKNVIH